MRSTQEMVKGYDGMMNQIKDNLKAFRSNIYSFFPSRQDAAMELVDSLSSNTHAKSVVELSLNPLHRRNYCSITRAIDEYYPDATAAAKQHQNRQLTKILSECCPPLKDRNYHLFGLDCTPQARVFSKTLVDRGLVHAPNPIFGNKPITIGHQYSLAVYFPEKLQENAPPWVIPLSSERVSTQQKGTLVGMKQVADCMAQPVFQGTLCVSVGDCAYSDLLCINEANKNPDQVHISRAKNNRSLYNSPKKSNRVKRGRPRLYGKKFRLSAKRLRNPDSAASFETSSKKGKELLIVIEAWNDILMRGKRTLKISPIPFRLIRVRIFSASSGELIYERPMWLIVSGNRRDELSLEEIYKIYRQRFDIEHFFKFGKNKLLMDKTQTPDVNHEEAWWQFVMMAYAQLYASRQLAENMPMPWQKYLCEFKSQDQEKSPTQVQKSFYRIIQEIGTPAQPPKQRIKSIGRQKGDVQIKRQHHDVVVKSKNMTKYAEMIM
jgi:hypothetical protein